VGETSGYTHQFQVKSVTTQKTKIARL